MNVKVSDRASANFSVLALVLSIAAFGVSGYSLWLEPARVRLRIQEIEAQQRLADSNLEVAKATIQLTEWLEAQERRFDGAGKRVSP